MQNNRKKVKGLIIVLFLLFSPTYMGTYKVKLQKKSLTH